MSWSCRVWIVGVWLMSMVGGLLSCQRTKPQTPANRQHEAVDSAELAQMYFMQRMVAAADTELAQFVQTLDTAYILDERGYWYRFVPRVHDKQPTAETIQREQALVLHVVLYTLQGQMLADIETTVVVGHDLPMAIDDILRAMQLGERVSLLVPWYAGYGATGNAYVPPYTNVRAEVECGDRS